jgi:catechol 2,3-dioxygenase-like lactoylglutathione lyase family enzyme
VELTFPGPGKIAALAVVLCTALSSAQTPSLSGIAHVAFRVADIEASRSFYRKLGLEEFFEFQRDGKTTEAFLKINDRQFIELYPAPDSAQPAALMHVCYEASDLQAVRAEYAGRGLNPPEVRKAGAGNLLLVLHDPEQQVIEYTQYMPGSRHTEDRGKHLGPSRISRQLLGVAFPVGDAAVERSYYVGKLGFMTMDSGEPSALRIPGDSGQCVRLEPAGAKPALSFAVSDAARAAEDLRKRGFPVNITSSGVSVTDPDGDTLTFTAARK